MVRKTGCTKYLPISVSENDDINHGIIVVTDAAMRRSNRGIILLSVFTNVGGIHRLANLKDINIASYIERKKRSYFTERLIKADDKLLDGSPGGFFVEMLKTVARPIYH